MIEASREKIVKNKKVNNVRDILKQNAFEVQPLNIDGFGSSRNRKHSLKMSKEAKRIAGAIDKDLQFMTDLMTNTHVKKRVNFNAIPLNELKRDLSKDSGPIQFMPMN